MRIGNLQPPGKSGQGGIRLVASNFLKAPPFCHSGSYSASTPASYSNAVAGKPNHEKGNCYLVNKRSFYLILMDVCNQIKLADVCNIDIILQVQTISDRMIDHINILIFTVLFAENEYDSFVSTW